MAFYCSLGLLLVLLGVLSEVILSLTGKSTYLLYFLAPPAIMGTLLTGAVRRTFQRRTTYYWMAFFIWMVLAIPGSVWPGGSFHRVLDYGRVNMLLLFMAGGLAATWKDVRLIFYTIGVVGLLNLLTARLFMSTVNTDNSRMALNAMGSSIGNSNDLAAQLLLVVPFMLFIALDDRRHTLVRIAILGPIVYGVWVIVGTASRGAMLGLLAMAIFVLWRAPTWQRIALLAGGLILAVVIPLALPQATRDRLSTLFGKQYEEADQSSASRSYLFGQSVKFTFQYPIFGVGPDQFSTHEGSLRVSEGKVGSWHATHCTWTQVSSECGLPAFIFFVLGVLSALGLVNRTYRVARAKGHNEIANACFCYLLSMAGFLVAVTFLASGYRLYFPVMLGLAIAISLVANQHMNAGAGERIPIGGRRA